jgi:CheY-like chemotaxis protein
MLTLPSNSKRKNRGSPSSLDRNEKDEDIHSASATKVTRLSESDKEILKVSLSSYPHEEQEQKTVGKKESRIDTGSILVLDDDFDINNMLKMALQKHGYHVFGFTDPLLALEHFKINHSTYSIVLSDLRMPVMNGFEFVRQVKKMSPKIKVLLMTAFEINEMEFTRILPKPEVDGFIQKPISIRKLNGIIDKYLTSE